MQSVIGALRVVLGADTAQFDDGMNRAQAKMATVGKKMQAIGANMQRVGAGLSLAITAPIIAAGGIAVREATEMQHAVGQVNAALTSMGAVAGRSFGELAKQAERLSATSLFEDDDILKSVTANLLTFGNVAGDAFDRAQQAALNLSTRMGTDLQSSTLMIGKALNDPAAGVAKLTRVGIQFTEQQKAQIKAMAAAGNAAGAQAVMLSELERQFGGAAEAARAADPMAAAMLDIKNALGELGAIMLPFVSAFSKAISSIVQGVGKLNPAGQGMVVALGLIAAAVGPVLMALGLMASGIGVLLPLLAPMAAFILPVVAALAALGAVAYIFRDDLAPAMEHFSGVLKETIGPKIAPLVKATQALFATFASAMKGFFGDESGSILPLLKTLGTVIARVFGAALDVITGAINIITNIMNAFGAALRGDWSAMWGFLGAAVMSAVEGIGRAFQSLFPNVSASVSRMVSAVREWFGRKLGEILTSVIDKTKQVGDAFFRLYDAVVGHSYVPDMVEGIAAWMAKLDAGMVVPAVRATSAAKAAFETLRDDVANIMESLLTDTERAARELANKTKIIQDAVRAGMMSRQEGRTVIGGIAGQDLEKPDVPQLERRGPNLMDPTDFQEMWARSQARIKEDMARAADEFGFRFSDTMQRVLRGDIKGVFNDILNDVLSSVLKKVGTSIFNAFKGMGQGGAAGGGGGGGGWMSTIASLFGKLPKFNQGGSFDIGGRGGIDNNLVQFWGSKGETVDIHKKGADRGPGGGVTVVVNAQDAVLAETVKGWVQGAMNAARSAGETAVAVSAEMIPSAQLKASQQRFF